MSNIDYFSSGFVQAVARSKQKAKQHVEAKQQVQQLKKVSGNVVATTAKTTTRMTDEEYKHFIIAKAIQHIIKQRGTM